MLTRSDTLVFSGSQTCGILLFRTRAESSFGEQKVKDSDRLELDWLLKCKLEELILTGNEKLRAEGKADKAAGAGRQAAGDIKDAARKAADSLKRRRRTKA